MIIFQVMEETSTQITWPSKLKIGAKSKKGIFAAAFTFCFLPVHFYYFFTFFKISVFVYLMSRCP